MKRHIFSADNKEGKTTLEDLLDKIDDDFDFVVAGIEKLDRDGSGTDAIAIASSIPVVASVLRFFRDFADSINKLKKLFII